MINDKSKSLEMQVFTQLEEDILTGVYKSGEHLTEISLSERLGVSRTPIRSALHRLAEEGLVEIMPNRYVKVVGVTAEDLIDTYNVRMRLEGLASYLAATRMSDEDKKRLLESVELSEFYISRNDAENIKELDTKFHNIIYEASGNRMLARILGELHRNIKTYRKMSLCIPGRLEKSNDEHREILNAILAQDAEKADRLTSLHIERAMNNMLESIELEKNN